VIILFKRRALVVRLFDAWNKDALCVTQTHMNGKPFGKEEGEPFPLSGNVKNVDRRSAVPTILQLDTLRGTQSLRLGMAT